MKTMMKVPQEWNASQLLKVAVLTVALTLTACGGGGAGGGSTQASVSIVNQIKTLIESGTAANLEIAMDLLLTNQDSLTAAQFEALMDAISFG